MRLCKKIFRVTLLALIMLVLLGGTVLATYSYYATVQVQETGGNSYDYLPIITDVDNDYLADNGYISLTGLDTRVLLSSTELKHMVVDDKTLFVAPSIGAHSTGNYKYTLGNLPLDSLSVVVGYDGYITVPDADALELGDSFEVEVKGYINTSYAADKNLVYKANAFKLYISAEGSIKAEITGGNSVTATDIDSGVHTVKVKADGINLEIYVDDMVIPKATTLIGASVPDENTDWLLLQNNVMPYAEYIKVRVA